MKINFNKAQVAQVAKMLRVHKKMYVTTAGQMFTSKPDAEEAVRRTNEIINEPDDYVSLVELTEANVTKEKLVAYAKDVAEFAKLFEKSYIPRSTKFEAKKFEKKKEVVKPVVKADADEIDAILKTGVSTETKPTETKTDVKV